MRTLCITLLTMTTATMLWGCSDLAKKGAAPQPAAPAAKTETQPVDKERAKIEARIAKLTDEDKAAIEKVKAAFLTVNGNKSAVSVGEIIEDTMKNPSVKGVGWEAFKQADGSFRVMYNFRDAQGKYDVAAWVYNPKTGKVDHANKNAMQMSWRGKK